MKEGGEKQKTHSVLEKPNKEVFHFHTHLDRRFGATKKVVVGGPRRTSLKFFQLAVVGLSEPTS